MNKRIDKIKKLRQVVLNQIAELSIEQLNKIPANFQNNIVWNLSHMIAAQQTICYVRAGLPIAVEEKFFGRFISGTKPDGVLNANEIDLIKETFTNSLDQLQADYDRNIFHNYTPSPGIQKAYGITLENIDEALEYVLYHEGLHAGYISALKHIV